MAKKYKVKKGDTLNKIARMYGGKSYKDVGISGYKSKNPNLIYPGEELTIGSQINKSSDTSLSPGDTNDNLVTNDSSSPGKKVLKKKSDDSGYFPRLSAEERRLREELTTLDEAPDLESIRREMERGNQGLINAITQQYAGTIAEERAAGDVRNSRQRAINISSGLGGSDFATAGAVEVEGANKQAINQIVAEREAKIAEVLSGIANRSYDQYNRERDKYSQKAEKALEYRQQFKEEALSNVSDLVKSGITSAKLKEESPDSWKELLKQTGYTDEGLTAYFISQRPEKEKVFSEKVGGKMVFGYRDPSTGEISVEKIDIGEGEDDFKVISGKPYFIDYKNGKIRLASGYEGDSPKAKTFKGDDKFDTEESADYFYTLPADFRRDWERNYGTWGSPNTRTSFEDLQNDYNEWLKNNPIEDEEFSLADL